MAASSWLHTESKMKENIVGMMIHSLMMNMDVSSSLTDLLSFVRCNGKPHVSRVRIMYSLFLSMHCSGCVLGVRTGNNMQNTFHFVLSIFSFPNWNSIELCAYFFSCRRRLRNPKCGEWAHCRVCVCVYWCIKPCARHGHVFYLKYEDVSNISFVFI